MRDKQKVMGTAGGAVGLGGIAAVLSACCVAPWAVSLLGAAGAVTLARLSFLQPFLLIGAVLLLSVTFWFAYRPVSACEGADCDATSRFRLRWLAWSAAAIVALLVAIACVPMLG